MIKIKKRISRVILNKSFEEILEMGKIKNTGITIFDPFPKLKVYNCARHLD